MTTDTAVYMCPSCSSTFVELGEGTLSGTGATVQCRACPWAGSENELIAAAFQHNMGSHTDLTQALVNDLRLVLAKEFAASFGIFLLKWGFVESPVPPLLLGRYISAIAKAVLGAVIKERSLLEREKVNGN